MNQEEKLQFFLEKMIGFDNFIEMRMLGGRRPEQVFVENYRSFLSEYTKYKKWNIYVGVNPRKVKSGSSSDVSYYKNIVFDLEGEIKHPLSDRFYQKRLGFSMKFLCDMLKNYGLEMNCLVRSGRGIHLYFTFDTPLPLSCRDYVESWYRNVMKEFSLKCKYGEDFCENPDEIVKLDSVFDSSRILGCPFTKNIKYDEPTALRNILLLNENFNDGENFVEFIKKTEHEQVEKNKIDKAFSVGIETKKYSSENMMFKCPELRILLDYSNVPSGMRYTNIILPIKMIMRDNGFTNYNDIISAIVSSGYDAPKIDNDFPENRSYTYSTSIFRSWCTHNFKWCVENDYKIPKGYGFIKKKWKKEGKVLPIINDDTITFEYDFDRKIVSWESLVDEIRNFNKQNIITEGLVVKVGEDNFRRFIKKYVDENLQKFIRMNNLELYLMRLQPVIL